MARGHDSSYIFLPKWIIPMFKAVIPWEEDKLSEDILITRSPAAAAASTTAAVVEDSAVVATAAAVEALLLTPCQV